jgi:hypothetical protein
MDTGVQVVVRMPRIALAHRHTIADHLFLALRDTGTGEVTGQYSYYGEDGQEPRCEIAAVLSDFAAGLAALRKTLRAFGAGDNVRIIRLGPEPQEYGVSDPPGE